MTENKMAWQEGYEAGYAAAQEEIDKLAAELVKCEEQYNKLWEYTQEKHKQISKLTAERDALLADVKDYQGSICCYCKHYNRNRCEHFDLLPKEDGIPLMCGKWEWRGINHE